MCDDNYRDDRFGGYRERCHDNRDRRNFYSEERPGRWRDGCAHQGHYHDHPERGGYWHDHYHGDHYPGEHMHPVPHPEQDMAENENDYMEELHDPVDFAKGELADLTEEVFAELFRETAKKKLQEKWGEQIEELAEVMVDRFMDFHKSELDFAKTENEYTEKIRNVFFKNSK